MDFKQEQQSWKKLKCFEQKGQRCGGPHSGSMAAGAESSFVGRFRQYVFNETPLFEHQAT
jgi:hypothetical protein